LIHDHPSSSSFFSGTPPLDISKTNARKQNARQSNDGFYEAIQKLLSYLIKEFDGHEPLFCIESTTPPSSNAIGTNLDENKQEPFWINEKSPHSKQPKALIESCDCFHRIDIGHSKEPLLLTLVDRNVFLSILEPGSLSGPSGASGLSLNDEAARMLLDQADVFGLSLVQVPLHHVPCTVVSEQKRLTGRCGPTLYMRVTDERWESKKRSYSFEDCEAYGHHHHHHHHQQQTSPSESCVFEARLSNEERFFEFPDHCCETQNNNNNNNKRRGSDSWKESSHHCNTGWLALQRVFPFVEFYKTFV